MKKVIYINLSNLSLRDLEKFFIFYENAKGQSPSEIVFAWNKYSKSIHQHVFIRE